MTTKRTPINRPPRDRITPEALAAFRRMHELENECTCPEREKWQTAFGLHPLICRFG